MPYLIIIEQKVELKIIVLYVNEVEEKRLTPN